MAVLFSGGTDSTLAAALAAETHERVHLVTYDRFGLFDTESNTSRAAKDLIERFGPEKMVHDIIHYDKLFQFTSYENYLSNLMQYRFFLLSTCGLCKLAMHVRTIAYCMDNGIQHASDGANKGMDLFPAQMENVLAEIRGLYKKFDIDYTNPVFDYEPPEEGEFLEKQNLAMVKPAAEDSNTATSAANNVKTTGYRLQKMRLAPADNVKGTAYDRERQPRCFQFILFNVFAKKYYLASHSMEEYKEDTLKFYKAKIKSCEKLLTGYKNDGSNADILKA
jgi:hypothetical protein